MVREPLERACHHFAALTWCRRLRPEGRGEWSGGRGGGKGGELKDREERTLCLKTTVFLGPQEEKKIKIDFFSIRELT